MPEIRVIAPGRTYRVDSDATHSPMFHQCEGLWLGENVSFKDLKVVFTDFCRTFFETDDLACAFGPASSRSPSPAPRSTSSSRAARWPAAGWRWPAQGQVHPSGAQHGAGPREVHRLCLWHGPDRLTMLRYGVNDLRLFFDGDMRFLSPVPLTPESKSPNMQFPESWLREFCNPPLTTANWPRP
jgi:phenylalanyl-tRNA synthetase alpha chain